MPNPVTSECDRTVHLSGSSRFRLHRPHYHQKGDYLLRMVVRTVKYYLISVYCRLWPRSCWNSVWSASAAAIAPNSVDLMDSDREIWLPECKWRDRTIRVLSDYSVSLACRRFRGDALASNMMRDCAVTFAHQSNRKSCETFFLWEKQLNKLNWKFRYILDRSWKIDLPSILSYSSSSSYSSSLNSSVTDPLLTFDIIELVRPGWLIWWRNWLVRTDCVGGIDVGISMTNFLFFIKILCLSWCGDGRTGSSL